MTTLIKRIQSILEKNKLAKEALTSDEEETDDEAEIDAKLAVAKTRASARSGQAVEDRTPEEDAAIDKKLLAAKAAADKKRQTAAQVSKIMSLKREAADGPSDQDLKDIEKEKPTAKIPKKRYFGGETDPKKVDTAAAIATHKAGIRAAGDKAKKVTGESRSSLELRRAATQAQAKERKKNLAPSGGPIVTDKPKPQTKKESRLLQAFKEALNIDSPNTDEPRGSNTDKLRKLSGVRPGQRTPEQQKEYERRRKQFGQGKTYGTSTSREDSARQLEKKDWIGKAADSIEDRGTEGKCTPITKPGCTGRALALAKTFKKIGRKRDAAVVSKKEKAAKNK